MWCGAKQVEAELVELAMEDRREFLESLGVSMEDCGLRALVRYVLARAHGQTDG